jgi:HAD superfamily hydrolase (TIGR01509 family)
MIKLVIYDLDGVLVELKDSHFHCLNEALSECAPGLEISLEEHYKIYDGLPTKEKLKLLTRYKKLDESLYGKINKGKQQYTLQYIYKHVEPIKHIIELFKRLKSEEYKICVASNSVANTVYSVLVKMELLQYVDKVFSNEDVKYAKPNPEIYFKAISHFGLTPKECVIVEDSPYGLEAAFESGAHVIKVKNTQDVNCDNIYENINRFNRKKKTMIWNGKNFNVLIPMAGHGSRFQKAGYKLPKPLIDVQGMPMIEKVVRNLNIDANFIFVVQREHEQYNVSETLNRIAPGCKIIYVDAVTEGAACTTLLAKEYINNDNHLLLVNSDQYIEWDSNRFYYQMTDQDIDGGIVSFKASHPKWSFAKLGSDGFVSEVAEKNPISDIATVGIYYWSKGSDYVRYAEQMINKNIRVNNEFYVCPVFNEAISDSKKFITYNIEKMWGLGTPEDLTYYLEQNPV